jgi:hypothetical protein
MKGSAFIEALPKVAGQEREDAIIKAVQAGHAIVWFTPLEISEGGHTLRLDVAMDAVKIGEQTDAVRVAADPITQQIIADHLGCLLPTAKICDLIWKQVLDGKGIKLKPHTQPPDSHMSDTDRFVEHSDAIDRERDGHCGLMWPVGKVFALSAKVTSDKCANYGWHVTSGSQFSGVTDGVIVLQPLATAHSKAFTDYSQLCGGLVKRVCYLDGEEEDLAQILKDPALCSLVSTEGPLDAFMYQRSTEPSKPDPATWRSPLKKGMQGSDVARMQMLLISAGMDLSPYGEDGDFGNLTEMRVKEFQGTEGLVVDGICGPQTMTALNSRSHTMPSPPPSETTSLDELVDDFIKARNYTPANRTDIQGVVLHSTESGPTSATAVARWFSGPSAPRASAHFIIDRNSTIQCVSISSVAWAAPGANRNFVQIEHCGYAMKSHWLEEESETLDRSARIVAHLCQKYEIPVEFLNEADLKAGKKGITTHYRVSMAFKKSDHVDPGGPEDRNWPLTEYLDIVKSYL